MPYRVAHVDREKRVAEAGIVSDMVRQFADKHAFLRELVQNGIDAGAARIDVSIDRDDTGVVRTSVTDDGTGMTRAIIEGPLLTLFSSSKEGDASKIGKYGIGFVSVFALDPDYVEVRTQRAQPAAKNEEQESWLLRLFGDHTWELAPGPVEPGGHGTTVTLVQPMSVEQFTEHARASEAALSRWCRHAHLPIDLVVLDAGDPAATRTIAIQEPFTAGGLVSVSWSGKGDENGERIVASAGGKPQGSSFFGCYSRGLTLFESTEEPDRSLAGVCVKIDSPKLSHTLSRDNVVRDRELSRLLERAIELVASSLGPEVYARVKAAAETAAAPADYVPYVEAVAVSAFPTERARNELVVPLVDPVEGSTTLTLRALVAKSQDHVLFADDSSPLTRALAKAGRPVLRWAKCIVMNRFLSRVEIEEAAGAVAYAGPAAERHASDAALEAALSSLLQRLDRAAERVQIAHFEGVGKTDGFRVTGERESVLPLKEAHKRAWGHHATVQLNVEDAAVRLARRRSRTDPVIAAHLLCRALLLADGPLSAKIVDRMLEAALE